MKIRIKRKVQKAIVLKVKNRGTSILFTEGNVTISQPQEGSITIPFDISKDAMVIPVK